MKFYLVVGLCSLIVTGSATFSRTPYFGTAVAMDPFRNDREYRAVLDREFDMIVAENAFKWSELRPGPDTFDFDDADALVAYASATGKKIRGHTLVWHRQLPKWLLESKPSRDEAIAILREHISRVVGRYAGRVDAWDVVNEAIDDDAKMRDSFWLRTIGPDYVGLAFEFAHDADPKAKLYYNDYSIEDLSPKSDAVFDLVRDLKKKGVAIDGVGWQAHVIAGFRIGREHLQNSKRIRELGLELSITELDLRIELPSNVEKLRLQADSFASIARFCKADKNCKALVMWGFTDAHSWIPGAFPGFGDALIFDTSFRPKQGYDELRRVFPRKQV